MSSTRQPARRWKANLADFPGSGKTLLFCPLHLCGMPAYWMITNRAVNGEPGGQRGPLSYWVADKGPLDNFKSWKSVSAANFQTLLLGAADQFPSVDHCENEKQSHVSFFIQVTTRIGRSRGVTCRFRWTAHGPTALGCASASIGHHWGACSAICPTARTPANARMIWPMS